VMDSSNKKGKRPDAPLDAKQDTLLLKDYPAAYNIPLPPHPSRRG
jgi:sister-chromatid-cohesion protein PDS5